MPQPTARNHFLVELDDATRPLENPDEITYTAAMLLGRHLEVNRCAYADVEADQDTFNLLGDYNDGVNSIVGRYTFTQFGVECLRLMRAGEPYVVTDSELDPRADEARASYRLTQIRAVICVPLLKGGRFVAAMAVHQANVRQWTADEVELVERVASRCWESIERTRVTRELRESEQRLRLAQDAGRIGSFEWNLATGRVIWSHALERLYGIPGGGFEGKLDAWAERVVPEDAQRVLTGIREIIANRGELYNYDFRALMPSGEHRWLRGQAQFSYDASGAAVKMIGVNIDIDEQKRAAEALAASEARFRGVVEATPECVMIVGPDGELLYINSAGIGMVEGESEISLHGVCTYDLIASEYRDEWRRNHRRVCEGERLTWEFEIVGLKGARRWMETHAVPLPLPDQRVAQLAVTRDITARKKAEVEREALLHAERAARANAERASNLKDEFLATLSHELRTPLNAILGWTHILRRKFGDAAVQKDGLEVIERNARSQAQIVDDLLDMNRIISGKIRLEVQRVDLTAIVQNAVESLRPTADAKGVRIDEVLDSRTGMVAGDPSRLQQIFWNLLSNGVKFTPRGGRVQVLLEGVGSHVEISVSDTGEGIKPEFLPHVFDRFRQADASTTRRHGGLGLGLAIAKQLVELHGGTIRAKSDGEGRGSTFSVTLPLAAIRAAEDTPNNRAPAGLATVPLVADISLSGVKVLVVDDESDARDLVRRLLEECSAQVETAGSAAEAMDRLSAAAFDVLVSDVGMPQEDGYSLLRRLRTQGVEHARQIPAIALTAYARTEDRMRAMLAGFQMHVAKPVEAAELVTMVASLAGRTGGLEASARN